jgi:hypothetical protein
MWKCPACVSSYDIICSRVTATTQRHDCEHSATAGTSTVTQPADRPTKSALSQSLHVAHLLQQCHNSKMCDFSGETFECSEVLVQRRHNCSPAAGFTNYVMTLYQLKAHLQTFLSIPTTQKCQILSCDTLVANGRHICVHQVKRTAWPTDKMKPAAKATSHCLHN